MKGEAKARSGIHTGGCLCGAVRYEVTVALGPVSFCHCGQCRRQHGYVGAYTTFPREGLRWLSDESLVWYQSSDKARRGFCGRCGSGIIWDPIGEDRIDVAAGSLDQPTGIRADRHIFVTDKADFHDIPDEGLVRMERGGSALAEGLE